MHAVRRVGRAGASLGAIRPSAAIGQTLASIADELLGGRSRMITLRKRSACAKNATLLAEPERGAVCEAHATLHIIVDKPKVCKRATRCAWICASWSAGTSLACDRQRA